MAGLRVKHRVARAKWIAFLSRNRKQIGYVAILGAISIVSGCSSISGLSNEMKYNRSWDSFVTGYRNTAWSSKAWHRRKHQFCRERYLTDFCNGFRAGYEDVADGADGCTPAFPPKEYWGWKYQSAEGQAKVAAWFSGYPHGARAAEEDGVGNWTQIQTSSNIQAEYAQFGMMPNGQSGVYPIAAPLPAMNGAAAPVVPQSPEPDPKANASLLHNSVMPAGQYPASTFREMNDDHYVSTDGSNSPQKY